MYHPISSCRRQGIVKSTSSMLCAPAVKKKASSADLLTDNCNVCPARSTGTDFVAGASAHSRAHRMPTSHPCPLFVATGFGNGRRRVFPDDAMRNHTPWCADLPHRPDGLLERADFTLSGDERDFLIDRLINAQPDCPPCSSRQVRTPRSLRFHLGAPRLHVIPGRSPPLDQACRGVLRGDARRRPALQPDVGGTTRERGVD